MRPSGTPQEAGLGAGSAAGSGAPAAGDDTATVTGASWAAAGNPANATTADSNTISRIRFFKAVLLFLSARVWPVPLFRRARSRARARHKFGRTPLGPWVVRLREAHALIERRMIVKPEFHGGRGIWLLEIDFTQDLKRVRRHHGCIGNHAMDYFESVLVGLVLQVTAVGV